MKKLFIAAISVMAIALSSCGGNNNAECPKCAAAENDSLAVPAGTVTITPDGQKVYTRDITVKSDNFVYDADSEWERTPDPGEVYRKVMGYNDNMMMVKVKFTKGSQGKMHSHPHVQITYVESGAFEFTINGVTKVVKAGDVLMKEPNVVHGCTCLEDGMLIDTFTPMRSTFIAK